MKTAHLAPILLVLAACGPDPDPPPTVVNVYVGDGADGQQPSADAGTDPADSGPVSDVSGWCPKDCGDGCCSELDRGCVDLGGWCGDGPEPLVCQSKGGTNHCAWCGLVGRPCCEDESHGLKFCHVGTCHGGQVCAGG